MGHHVVIDAGRRVVTAFCGQVGAHDDAESAANARLYAAAPQLLAAAEAAIAYDAAIQRYAVHGKSWVNGDDLDALYATWINAARASFAQALGSNA